VQRQAWEHAQQVRQQQWKEQQEKRMNAFERQLDIQVQQLHAEWQTWQAKEATRVERLTREYASAIERAYREHEVAGLPHINRAPLTSGAKSLAQRGDPYWRPAHLQDTDLSHRDLSERYLSQANLRNAQLINANLYMSDLSGACLAGANLIGANLIGANLIGADLRGANLTGANLLVADLNNAVLVGANLLSVRNLTVEQVHTTLYDITTQFDPELGITLPLLASIAEPEAPLSTSLSDTPTGSGLAADTPENTSTGESGTNPPRRRGNGRKRAEAN
jgi:hypothetical protein